MNRFLLPIVLFILAGCAAQRTEPSNPAAASPGIGVIAADAQLLAAADTSASQVEVADFTSTTVCRKVVRTGSRLIRGEVCSSPDNASQFDRDYNEKKLEWDLDDINRMQEAAIYRHQMEMWRFMGTKPPPAF